MAIANRPFNSGKSVSPESCDILIDQYDESGSDLVLVEDFESRPAFRQQAAADPVRQ